MFVRALWLRVGGAIGQSTTDLNTAAFEDAGIAEQQWEIDLLADAGLQGPPSVPVVEPADQMPPAVAEVSRLEALESQVNDLLAQVAEMSKTISALQQGATP